jgi:hypothetical protein
MEDLQRWITMIGLCGSDFEAEAKNAAFCLLRAGGAFCAMFACTFLVTPINSST